MVSFHATGHSFQRPKKRKSFQYLSETIRQICLARALGTVWSLVGRKAPVQTARAQAIGRRRNGQIAGRKGRFAGHESFHFKSAKTFLSEYN